MNNRGIGGVGIAVFALIIFGAIFYFAFQDEASIIQNIGKNYEYRGSFTNEATAEDAIDIFGSAKAPEVVKVDLESYMKPFMPAKLNNQSQYVMSYKDSVVIVSNRSTFDTKSVKLKENDQTVIALYPPKVAEKEYNGGGEYDVYVHSGYQPMYYRRYRNRYVSIHFHPRYRGFYRRRYRSFGYGSRGFGRGRSSRRSFGGSGFRGGGSSWGK
ncbi:hypothetical protein KAJ27_20905 [bacterium]|nr:hypothetical protein [bacterium]